MPWDYARTWRVVAAELDDKVRQAVLSARWPPWLRSRRGTEPRPSVPPDDPDHRAQAGGGVEVGEQRAAAGSAGVAAAAEHQLGGAERTGVVAAEDRAVLVIGIADDRHQLAGRLSGTQALGAGDILHYPGQFHECDVVVWIRRGGPVLIGDHATHGPGTVGRLAVTVAGHERDLADRTAGQAMRGGNDQVPRRAVDDAGRAEVSSCYCA
jgi:hypothetical protein